MKEMSKAVGTDFLFSIKLYDSYHLHQLQLSERVVDVMLSLFLSYIYDNQ
jgi:hypothetical protein